MADIQNQPNQNTTGNQAAVPQKTKNTSWIAITALVLGIISLMLCLLPIIGQILAITAIIFGIVGLVKINKDSSLEGKGLAIAGIIVGSVSLLIALAIFFIGYFMVLNPSTMIPEHCTMASGLSCDEWVVKSNSIGLMMGNGLGRNITITSGKITDTESGASCTFDKGIEIGNGENANLFFDCGSILGKSSERIKANVEIVYYFSDSSQEFSHTVNGDLYAKVSS